MCQREYDSYGRIVKTGWINTTTPYTASSIPAIADANKLTETQYYIGSNYVQNEGKRVLKPTGVSTVRDFIWSYTARISPYAYRGNPGWMGEQHLMSTTYRNGVDAKDTPIQDADHEGVDWVTAGFDGLQQPTAAYRYLFSANSLQEVRTANVFTYDDLHRLTALNYGYGTGGSGVGNQASLSNMVYNYKNQLVQKNIGYANGKYLQGIDYGYNSRGWLTSINGGNIAVYNSPIATQSTILKGTVNNLAIAPYLTNLANNYAEQTKLKMAAPTAPPPTAHQNIDLFTERIYYNDADGRFGAAQQNNGNIQAVAWQVGGKDAQGYGFTYDDLDRLINSNYFDIQNTVPGSINGNTSFSSDNKYQETVAYDVRGNITSLQRNGLIGGTWTATGFTAATYGQIDNMTYTYNNQNQITKIIDVANLGKGFKSVNNANTTQYTYDANGNITSDLNKGITNIAYNYLNLPQVITFTGNRSLTFVYNADGEKLEKIVNNNSVITTTDYVNGVEYKNANINRIAHSEGAVVLNENNALQHEYVLRDHLGNVRVTFRDGINLGNAYVDWSTWTYVDPNANNPSFNDGTITASDIKQINHYYPFGLNMEGNWNGAVGTNKYQYNEKELNDDFGLNWMDYGARFYDVAVGRFWSGDMLAELSVQQTPYAYAANNPVRFIDFMGLADEKPVEGGTIGEGKVTITDKNGQSAAQSKTPQVTSMGSGSDPAALVASAMNSGSNSSSTSPASSDMAGGESDAGLSGSQMNDIGNLQNESRPSFGTVQKNYPDYDMTYRGNDHYGQFKNSATDNLPNTFTNYEFFKKIGGSLGKAALNGDHVEDEFKYTCAIRTSYALSKSGYPGFGSRSGRIIRSVLALKNSLGPADIVMIGQEGSLKSNDSRISGQKGIIFFRIKYGDAGGHFALWDGFSLTGGGNHGMDNFREAIEIHLWNLK